MSGPDIEALYRAHERLLVAISWRILRRAEDAREVCQEAFARLLAGVRGGEEIRNPQAWLCRTALNLAIARVRRRPPPLRPEPLAAAAPHDAADRRRLLDAAIAGLPERQRVVFLLRHEQGLPLVEIAAMLGITPSTAGVHLTRALRALRDRLAPHKEDLT